MKCKALFSHIAYNNYERVKRKRPIESFALDWWPFEFLHVGKPEYCPEVQKVENDNSCDGECISDGDCGADFKCCATETCGIATKCKKPILEGRATLTKNQFIFACNTIH